MGNVRRSINPPTVRACAVVAAMILIALIAGATSGPAVNRWVRIVPVASALCLSGILLHRLLRVRRRETTLHSDHRLLTDAKKELEWAKTTVDEKNAQLQATLAGMSDGVAMVDGNMRLVEWNDRFPEIAGVPRDMLRVGLPMEDILRAQASNGQFDAVNVEQEIARRMAILHAGSFAEVTERQRPDGRVIELRRNRLPDGGFVTLYSDVTERKHVESALREARTAAENATHGMSRFVAIVSHEIRTPLNALLNTLNLLAGSGVATAQAGMVDMARRSGDALLALINDILEMSRMEAGQLALRPSVFALQPLVDSALEMFADQAEKRRIALRVSIAPDVPEELYEDPGRLRQVLINLLSNAVKFGAAGEVRVIAGMRRDARGASLRLTVRDRGPVIPEEGRARLFQPFSRLDEAGEAGPLGTGLGLMICRQLVGLMGGEIGCSVWTMGVHEAGNEFWIALPLKQPPTGAGVAQMPGPTLRILPRTRILLAEDTVGNQMVTATLLRRHGHLVDIVSHGEAAVRAVANRPYDMIFMDIFMPGMSGLDATRRIRAMGGPAARRPIVALTANVYPEERALCLAAGMNGMLTKPVALAALLDSIAQHVWPHHPARIPVFLPVTRTGTALLPVLSPSRLQSLCATLPPETLTRLAEDCLTEMAERLRSLRFALEAGVTDQIMGQAHALAGMAAEYGMAALEARCRALMRPPSGPARSVVEIGDELTEEMNRAAASLRAALQGQGAPPLGTPLRAEPLEPITWFG
jgi:signal transduction histidine kinase/CheY-like chemotaxis protein